MARKRALSESKIRNVKLSISIQQREALTVKIKNVFFYNRALNQSSVNKIFPRKLDSSIANACVILLAHKRTYSAIRENKWVYFMKSVTKSIISPHAQQRLQAPQTPKIVRQIMKGWGITSKMHKLLPGDTPRIVKRGWTLCQRSCDRQTKTVCFSIILLTCVVLLHALKVISNICKNLFS